MLLSPKNQLCICNFIIAGFVKISIDNLSRSDQQVRPLQQWKVERIVESMKLHADDAYQPYCVLTTDTLADRSVWSIDRVSILEL